jgi:hypothetical protein
MTARADQRRAGRSELLGGLGHDDRVLADGHDHPTQGRAWRVAGELAQGQHGGLPGLGERAQRTTGGRGGIAGQAEGQHGGGQLVAQQPDGRPDLPPPGGTVAVRDAGEGPGRAEHQSGQREALVEAVRGTEHPLGEPTERHRFPGQRVHDTDTVCDQAAGGVGGGSQATDGTGGPQRFRPAP